MIIPNKNCTCNDNFVYLNKIFYNESENASPIMTAFESTATGFLQQLNVGSKPTSNCGCNCGGNCGCNSGCNSGCNCCCDFTVTADTTFNINNSYVIVQSFQPTTLESITTADVTVEGLPVTSITVNGNQLVGNISGIMPQITRCACQPPCANICPGNYVMVTADGPWNLVATIVVEGTVTNAGTSCQFKLCYSTVPETPLSIVGPASFAFCGANIPCQANGSSPTLLFDFDACAKLLNPVISVTCTEGVCTTELTGSLVITPQINLQVLRPSLFNLGDREVNTTCDDLGQCDPCNSVESECIEPLDNCCCTKNSQPEPTIVCQCCDTNGYSF